MSTYNITLNFNHTEAAKAVCKKPVVPKPVEEEQMFTTFDEPEPEPEPEPPAPIDPNNVGGTPIDQGGPIFPPVEPPTGP